MSAAASTAAQRVLPWLLVLPALLFATPLSPIAGDPYPHLAGAGWTALALVPLALAVLARGASLAGAWPFLLVLAWALVARFAAPVSDPFEARRALLVLCALPLVFAAGAALDERGKTRFQDLLVLLSLAWTGFALPSGFGDDNFAGVLGDTGSLSQAALPGAAIGAVRLVRARGARRALGGIALALFLVHVAAAPVLAGSHTLLAGLLLGAWLGRGRGRGARAARGLGGRRAPLGGRAARELATEEGAPRVEGAPASPSHSLTGLGVRGLVWKAALGLVAEHPLTGAGPGQFQAAFPPYRDPREIELSRHGVCSELDTEVEHAHNDWLQAFLELGLPGGLLFVLGLALAARAALRALAHDERIALGVAALAMLVNALVHAPLFANPGSSALAFALLGTLAGGAAERRSWRELVVATPVLIAAVFFSSSPIRHGLGLRRYVQAMAELDGLSRAPGEAPEARAKSILEDAGRAALATLKAAPRSAPALLLACNEHLWQVLPDEEVLCGFCQPDASSTPAVFVSSHLDLLLAVRPNSVEAWERSATGHARQDRYELAHAGYERALRLSPTHPRILRNSARLECTLGDTELGVTRIELLRSQGCLEAGWVEALGDELILARGEPERGARVRFGRKLEELVPEELHASARAKDGDSDASECLAQLLWARDNAAAGNFDVALRNYRQAAERSHARRGTQAGPAPLFVLEQAAAEVRAGRSADAAARTAKLSLDPSRLASLPGWARAALAQLALSRSEGPPR